MVSPTFPAAFLVAPLQFANRLSKASKFGPNLPLDQHSRGASPSSFVAYFVSLARSACAAAGASFVYVFVLTCICWCWWVKPRRWR